MEDTKLTQGNTPIVTNSIVGAFSNDDFGSFTLEELTKDPASAKFLVALVKEAYSQRDNLDKQLVASRDEIVNLKAANKFYKSIPTFNIIGVILTILGNIGVGIGVKLGPNWWVVIISALVSVLGALLHTILSKLGDKQTKRENNN